MEAPEDSGAGTAEFDTCAINRFGARWSAKHHGLKRSTETGARVNGAATEDEICLCCVFVFVSVFTALFRQRKI